MNDFIDHALPFLVDRNILRDSLLTILFLSVLLIFRTGVRKTILHREDLSLEIKRRWLVMVRNAALAIIALGMILIWGHEIQNFAVSLVAVAAALVLATKEVILCMLGSIYRTSSHVYDVGDRIEIAGIKGQVIDISLISTTLVESSRADHHKGTVGRGIKIPNSMLFGNPVYNETMMGQFAIQTIHINLERHDDWLRAEQILLESGRAIIAEYADDLAQHAKDIASDYVIDTPLQQPRIRILLDHVEHLGLQLQLPAPLGLRSQIEQRVLRDFLLNMPAQEPRERNR